MNLIGKEETLLQMFPPPVMLGQLTKGIVAAVEKSFEGTEMRNPTKEEVKRRFEICVKAAKIMRGDLKFGMQRLLGELPNVLKVELRGDKWEPPTRQCWLPSDGTL